MSTTPPVNIVTLRHITAPTHVEHFLLVEGIRQEDAVIVTISSILVRYRTIVDYKKKLM